MIYYDICEYGKWVNFDFIDQTGEVEFVILSSFSLHIFIVYVVFPEIFLQSRSPSLSPNIVHEGLSHLPTGVFQRLDDGKCGTFYAMVLFQGLLF